MRNYNFSVVATAFHGGGVQKEFYSLKSALQYAYKYSSDGDEAGRLRVFPNNDKGIEILKNHIKNGELDNSLQLYLSPEIFRDIKKGCTPLCTSELPAYDPILWWWVYCV